MTYTFKLSRRMARFRATLPITAFFLGVACAGDPSGPGSTGTGAPSNIRISPDSVSLGLNQAVQFDASTGTSAGTVTLSRSGKGRGRWKTTIVSLTVAPETTTLQTGASSRFSAAATLSDGSYAMPSTSWTATGGTIEQTGLYTAGTTVGTYRVIATTTNGLADTAAVTVAVLAPVPARLVMSPTNDTLTPGATAQFTAVGKASDGTTVGVSPLFTATGGSVTSSGAYTAGQAPGQYRVIATDQGTGMADTSAVTITSTPVVLQSVVLSPATVTLASSQTKQFTASGTMSDGSTSSAAVTWDATGGNISSGGLYTAGQTSGSYRVIAADSATGRADTAVVTITTVPPTLQAVVLTPTTVSLASGATQQFTASGKMSDGSTAPISASFIASGGTISSTGFYTAGSTAGTYRVIATQSGGTLADTGAVSITTPPPPPPPSSGTTYFLADAESGFALNPPSFVASYCNAGGICPVSSTARAKTGTHSYKFEVVDPTVPPMNSAFALGSPQTSMGCQSGHFCSGWYSAWLYLDTGYDVPGWNATFNFLAAGSGGHGTDPIGHLGIGFNNGVRQLYWSMKNCQTSGVNTGGNYACPNVAGYQNKGGDYIMTASSPAGIVPLPKGQWVHVALYYKLSRTNGEIQIWQDGVMIEDITAPTLNTQDGFYYYNNTSGDMSFIGFGIYQVETSLMPGQRLFLDDLRISNYRTSPTNP